MKMPRKPVISVDDELRIASADPAYAQKVLAVAANSRREERPTIAECVLAAMPYERYLQTQHWQDMAQACKRAAKGRCQVCNMPGLLEAHHRTYERRGYEDAADLIALCGECHSLFHKAGKLAPREVSFEDWKCDPQTLSDPPQQMKKYLEHVRSKRA
jgi:5-methylcytosine-specific restriction endonuclease McrA